MNLIIMWSTWLATMLAFYFGFKIGQGKQETKEISINPIKTHKQKAMQREIEKEQEKQQEKFDVIRQNIDNYDGTPNGQKDIPM